MDVSLVQSFHLLVALKTFEAHGSKRLFVDAYTPSALCGRNWMRGNRHLFLFYFETHLLIASHLVRGILIQDRCHARATDITEVLLEIEEKDRCAWMPRSR